MEGEKRIGQLVNVTGDENPVKLGKVYLITMEWFGKTVGTLEMKGKKLHFEGDADKSARALFANLKKFVEQYIEERLGKGGSK